MAAMEQADPVGDLFARAKRHRVAIVTLCRRAGVDPTTPSRWKRKKNGANLAKVNLLARALDEVISEDAVSVHDGGDEANVTAPSPGKTGSISAGCGHDA